MLFNLQVLRGIAALLVVAVHIESQFTKLGIPNFGGFGVDIFFVISGFIMVHTTKGRSIAPVKFALDRILRIVPMYWFMTIIVFLVTLYAPFLFNKTFLDVKLLINSLFFIPTLRSTGLIQPLLYVGWTLNYEMFFYALFAIGLAFRRYSNGVAFVALSIITLTLLSAFGPYENAILRFYTHPLMLEFICGMGLGFFLGSITQVDNRWLVLPLIVLCVLSLLFGATIHLLAPQLALPAVIIFASLAVYSAIYLEALGVKITSKLPVALGFASYSIYLTHPFVAGAMNKVSAKFGTTILTSAIFVMFSYIIIAVVGYIVYLILERNLNGWLKALRKRFSAPPPVAAWPE